MALFVHGTRDMTGGVFVEIGGLLKAGHATQPRWLDGDSPVAALLHYHGRVRRKRPDFLKKPSRGFPNSRLRAG